MLEDIIATGDPVAVSDFVRWNHPSTWWTGEEPDKPAQVLFDEQNIKDPRGTVVNVWHELHGAMMMARQDIESRLTGELSESISLVEGGSYENVVEATAHLQVKIGEQENATERRVTAVLRRDSSQEARERGHTLGLKFGESDFQWWSPTDGHQRKWLLDNLRHQISLASQLDAEQALCPSVSLPTGEETTIGGLQLGGTIMGTTRNSVDSGDPILDLMALATESTHKLFYLLEGVESTYRRYLRDEVERGVGHAHGPSKLIVAPMSSISGRRFSDDKEYGPEGRLAQLAYVGWVAEVDGNWGKWRKKYPGWEKGKWGLKTELMGDFRRMRNDLLKNGGEATKDNTGRCKMLKWFSTGDLMVFRLDHALEFLHYLGVWPHGLISTRTNRMIHWVVREQTRDDLARRMAFAPKAVSFVVRRESHPVTKKPSLLLSVIYEDGVVSCGWVSEHDNREDQQDAYKQWQSAELIENGSLIKLPDRSGVNVSASYRPALENLLDGGQPAHIGTPWFKLGE